MIGRSYKSEGIVLGRRDYGEADRILTVYSRDYGKVSLMAKGVRRPRSRKRGHIEVFGRMRFSASKGKGMDIITEAELIDNYSAVRVSLEKTTLAYYFCEVVGRVTQEGERNEELYSRLERALGTLESTTRHKDLRKRFVQEVLVIVGFWPRGKEMVDPDKALEEVVERQMVTAKVGRKVLE